MNRREALSAAGLLVGGTVLGTGSILQRCNPAKKETIFGILDKNQLSIVEDLAEAILPKTAASPGAKDVEIGKYINSIVSDCSDEATQSTVVNGIKKLDELSQSKYEKNFGKLTSKDKNEVLLALEEESKNYNKNIELGGQPHYYTIMKGLTISGYRSSELVGTTVFRNVPIPGRYEGCLPYEQGEKSYI
jgi:hypothetical protein